VRVRVTLVAVVVTAVALAVGAWGLVRSVERTQLGRIASATEERVEAITAQLEEGVDPIAVELPSPYSSAGFVQLIGPNGDVLTASPAFGGAPVIVVRGSAPPQGSAGREVVIATGAAGGGTFEQALPGGIDGLIRYERIGDVTVVAASPLQEVTRSLDAVRRSLWIGLPLLVALVGAAAWFVTGRALQPVEAIRREVEAVSGSTLHRRVPEPAADDEIGRLARTMNAMLDRLEAASDRQRRFVADASHELRSPVAALRTELEVAQLTGDTDDLRAAIDGALAEEGRIEALLADLLLLASVDEGAAPNEEDVDLSAVVLGEAERERRLPVRVDATEPVVVRGSAGQLQRVVANLLDNAARHGSSVVEVCVEPGRLVVDDDGPGIPPDERERVFERFHRLDEARSRDAGGTGLGLAIVRALVERHGGRVWAEAAPSGGARLVVAF
jgi:signal transduction histidine kinase